MLLVTAPKDLQMICELSPLMGGGNLLNICNLIFKLFIPTNLSIAFCFWLRLCRHCNMIIRIFSKFKRMRFTRKYGVQISPVTEIGPGLMLPHFLSIVIHPKSTIGKNATIHQFVTIGGDKLGHAPVIGDNCFIGAGATIIGNIHIGNNVTVAAGAVVVMDVPDNATVGGVPAKIIHFKHPGKNIVNPIN